MNEKQQVLNLTNICDGKLEAEFEEMYKDALRKISKGQKAKITINIEMLRVPDTDTIVELGYNIKQHYQLSHVVLSVLMRTTSQ